MNMQFETYIKAHPHIYTIFTLMWHSQLSYFVLEQTILFWMHPSLLKVMHKAYVLTWTNPQKGKQEWICSATTVYAHIIPFYTYIQIYLIHLNVIPQKICMVFKTWRDTLFFGRFLPRSFKKDTECSVQTETGSSKTQSPEGHPLDSSH